MFCKIVKNIWRSTDSTKSSQCPEISFGFKWCQWTYQTLISCINIYFFYYWKVVLVLKEEEEEVYLFLLVFILVMLLLLTILCPPIKWQTVLLQSILSVCLYHHISKGFMCTLWGSGLCIVYIYICILYVFGGQDYAS